MKLQQSAPKGAKYQRGRVTPERLQEMFTEGLRTLRIIRSSRNRAIDADRELPSLFSA